MSRFFSIIAMVLIGLNGPVLAQSNDQQETKERAVLIEACVKEMRSGLKAGQVMSNHQRIMAEETCRARADTYLQSRRNTKP